MSKPLKRAQTHEQKYFRRQQILAAAQQYFLDVGYHAFTMANLAKSAGVVKGTLYLYFKTREEVLLTLYNQSLIRWSDIFIDRLSDGMADLDYVEILYKTALEDEIFIPLLSRLEQVIEHNVSIDNLIESKRLFIQRLALMAQATAPALALNQAQSSDAMRSLGILLMGATQSDLAPSLAGDAIPPDVLAFVDLFSSKTMFTTNACRIIAGIRTTEYETL